MKYFRYSAAMLSSVVFFLCGATYGADAPPTPLIQVVIFDDQSAYGDDVPKPVVLTRDSLRKDPRLEVFLFSPDSPTFEVAAHSAKPPLSLDNTNTPGEKQAISQAVGADFYIVLVPAPDGKKLTATVVSVTDGSIQSVRKPQKPDNVADNLAAIVENWVTPTAAPVPAILPSTAAPLLPTPVAVPSSIATQSVAPPTPIVAPPTAVTPPVASPVMTPSVPVPVSAGPGQSVTAPVAPVVLPPSPPAAVVNVQPASAPTAITPPVASPVITPSVSAPMSAGPVQSVAVQVAPIVSPPSPPAAVANVQPATAPAPEAATDVIIVSPPATPVPAVPSTPITQPTSAPPQSAVASSAESTVSDASKGFIDVGDEALRSSDDLTAIGYYQKAVNLSPRASTPRLKLAQAYLDAGMKDQASDEAKRALSIDPGNTAIQTFVENQVTGAGSSNGDVIVAQAKTDSDPNNPSAWIALGDAYWNVGDSDDSLTAYKRAADIDPTAILPQTRLAKLYAALAQYDQSLAALQKSGADGYPFALRIIASRTESLVGDIDDETDLFNKGQETREQFYDKIKVTDAQAEGLADFVSRITPPDQYRISHLHRELSTRLLAQTAAVWIDYAETNTDSDKAQAVSLEQHAINEMKTASVAEDLSSRINPAP